MDLERLTHRGYKTSVIVATVLSAMAVTFAALLGRSVLNVRGALVDAQKPENDVAAIYWAEQKGEIVQSVKHLRKSENTDAFQVTTDTGEYFELLSFDKEKGMWELATFERLHATPSTEK